MMTAFRCGRCGQVFEGQVESITVFDYNPWTKSKENPRRYERVRCARCGNLGPVDTGEATQQKSRWGRRKHEGLKKSYKRRTQLASETGWVSYGVLDRLEYESGHSIPDDFSGNIDRLAGFLGKDPEWVAERWNTDKALGRKLTVDELRERGNFHLSK